MLGFKSWAAVAAMVSALAIPQIACADDYLAYQAIKNRDWSAAEQQLQAGLQKDPGNTSRMLNLAFVYAQTGRKAEAAALYKDVLKRDKDRFASSSSHEDVTASLMAERGLSLLSKN